ncbi:hypothetical protein OXYTRIMIC_383 [Oxytricha trifallax]|uniref:Uncharacterized protein n=1 Tax=Oxytricha trifallax TaxID=1172189 RepID=A0A073HXE7_9SPIT|nr:hypothetical protein OXYTRIMIC_383 [Oxytricha trifallax]
MHQQLVENEFHMKNASLKNFIGYQQWSLDDIAVQKLISVEKAMKQFALNLFLKMEIKIKVTSFQMRSFQKLKKNKVDYNSLNQAESALEVSGRINSMASINKVVDVSINLPQPSIQVKAPSTSKQSKKEGQAYYHNQIKEFGVQLNFEAKLKNKQLNMTQTKKASHFIVILADNHNHC